MKSLPTLVCLVLAATAMADEGRRPIDTPTVITQPGSYLVTRGFTAADTAIVIQSDGVTLDLNGQTLTSTSTTEPVIDAEEVPGGILRGITIRNGTLSGGLHGVRIEVDAQGPMRFENLVIEGAAGDGFSLVSGREYRIVGCTIREIARRGIYSAAPTTVLFRIERNLIDNVGEQAILLIAPGGATIVDNTIRSTGGTAIYVNGDGTRVIRNTIHDAGTSVTDVGVSLRGDGVLVQDNVVVDGAGFGISVGSSVTTSSPGLVRGNTVSGHGNHGIWVNADNTLVEGNQITGNGGLGLYAFSNNDYLPYRDNMLRDNASGSTGGPGVFVNRGGNICDGVCP